ncbi:MAG TPA: GNAT family N-acetyltransferase [Allosphingosinicella sp.]|jgi:CelD/BcsL family acetyltransferase involved in cellulose biosynthesis
MMQLRAMPCPVAEVVPIPLLPAASPRVRVRGARELDPGLLAEWQALADRASESNCFQEPWFVQAGLRHLATDGDIRLLEIRDGELIGLIPLCVRSSLGRIPARNVQNWRHHNDFLGTPLVRAGREADFWTALLTHLDGAAWARGFLHLNGLVEDGPVHAGLAAAAAALGRPAAVVQRQRRAALASDLSPADYFERTVRKKKRKELKRLAARLGELGSVTSRVLQPGEDWRPWCDAFLALERSGWKGRNGSALACAPESEAFFRDALAGAAAAGRLQLRSLDLDGRPLAMLVNFLVPPGSFSFKIAFDEEYARFSPGVLIQIDNLDLLARGDVAWMDSCAAENHPMIDSLWGERRTIVRVSVPLAGLRRRMTYHACRVIEAGWAGGKRLLRRGS